MPSQKALRILGWAMSALLALLFIFSAVMKFVAPPEGVKMMTELGLKNQIKLIGAGELVSAILFLLPFTHPLGVLLLSSYMGGAILAHMSRGESYVGPSVILVAIWVAGFFRRPALLIDPHAPAKTTTGPSERA